jgi:hypothetical protein
MGGYFSISTEADKKVVTLKAYVLHDFFGYSVFNDNGKGYSDNLVTNKMENLEDFSVSFGYRFQYAWGSLIPAIGVSAGQVYYRGSTTDTNYVGPHFLGPSFQINYARSHYFYFGVPVSLQFITSSRFFGVQFGAYCNFHMHTDAGVTVGLALGRIREKKGV